MIPQIPINCNGKDLISDPVSIGFQKGNIYIYDDINRDTAKSICSSIRYLNGSGIENVNIYINSPGGSISDGFAIYDALKASDFEVSVIVEGMAASMAAFIVACAGTKGKRYSMPNAQIMIHQPLGGISGQTTDIRIFAEHIVETKNKLNRILSEATGKSISEIEVDTERDTWLTAEQALEYGIIDKIIYSYKELD